MFQTPGEILLQPRKKSEKRTRLMIERTFIEIEAVFADVWTFRTRGHGEQGENWYKCFPHFRGRYIKTNELAGHRSAGRWGFIAGKAATAGLTRASPFYNFYLISPSGRRMVDGRRRFDSALRLFFIFLCQF